MSQFTMTEQAMAMARNIATRMFRYDRDREEKVADAVSTAWEFSQTAPGHAKPGSVAYNAARHVAKHRQFQGESVRSIDCPWKPWMRASRGEFRRVHVDPQKVLSIGDDPAEIVALRMDLEFLLSRLSPRNRRIALLLAAGYGTREVALRFGLAEGRISQIRAELKAKWEALTS